MHSEVLHAMILDFDNACWSESNADWQRSLIELLMLVKRHESHSVLAAHQEMLSWCSVHLPLFDDYFKTRLMMAQPRANSLTISISPTGSAIVDGPPPWTLTAQVAATVINRPLQVFLENDESDRSFLTSAISSFAAWCERDWIEPMMGGGNPMGAKITAAGADALLRWRTFFVFDSDRLHPDELDPVWTPPAGDGCQGHEFETLCTDIPHNRWHCLERRSIENYLPASVLQIRDADLTETLFGHPVGDMAHFFNMKLGLKGDGVSPIDPKKTVRAARSQGVWTALSPGDVTTLERGFGRNVAQEFANVPSNHPWPVTVVAEMNMLAGLIQDAI